ncbi:MAG: LicD family protein [Spirochaetes bacterium]|nr:LicD family protein [Spirochaetota bacterium]
MDSIKGNISEDKIDEVRKKLGEKAGKLLERFYASGIPCWLDSGSLLGMVRNNKLNDWEKDIDLGIWFEDFNEAVQLSYNFAEEEKVKLSIKFLRGVPYKLSYVDTGSNSKDQLPFDIHIFYKLGELAWAPQACNLIKDKPNIPSSMYKSFLADEKNKRLVFIKFTLKYPRYAFCYMIRKMRLHYLIDLAMNVNWNLHYFFNRTFHQADSVIFRMFFELFEWRVQKYFFEDLKALPSRAPHLTVPDPIEDYLALRYGKDWRKPNSNWFYIFNDGCIFPADKYNYTSALNIYNRSSKD